MIGEKCKEAFYIGVEAGQRKMALEAVCEDIGIDYIEVKHE